MCAGSLTSVSLVTILIRRNFFRAKFERMVQTDAGARRRVEAIEKAQEEKEGPKHRFLHPKRLFGRYASDEVQDFNGHTSEAPIVSPAQSFSEKKSKRDRAKKKLNKFTTDMIHRVDQPGQVQRIIDNLATDQETAAAEDLERTRTAEMRAVEPPIVNEADDEGEAPASPKLRRGSIRIAPIKKRSSASSEPRLVASPTQLSGASVEEAIASSSSSEDESPARASLPRRRRASESIPRTRNNSADLQFKRVKTMGISCFAFQIQ